MIEASRFRDEILDDIFLTKTTNLSGIYVVKLYIRGKPWLVPVDDNFLYLEEQNNLRFAKYLPDRSTLWVPILEKALARVKGTYM